MPIDLRALVDPAHTAVVTQELQGGVVGPDSALPALAEAAVDVLPAVNRLVVAARASGVDVVHCLAERRPDGLGSNHNARLFGGVLKSPVRLLPGSEAAALVPEIGVEESDLVLRRLHGLGPMAGTDLDPILRNLGVTTIVGVGVSVNVGMTNFVMDAVNAGYQFVLPRDGVAGVPADYADAVIDNTLALLATVTTVDAVLACWSGGSR
ncbi:MAG: isochorismatase family protein [Acidimicrobiales bacterium]